MKFYDSDERIKHWSRCRDQISYVFDNKKRRYNPDFILEYKDGRVVVEEVKGLFTEMTLAKYDAAVKFYEERETEFVMMTKSSKNALFEHVERDVMIERIRGRDYWSVVTNPNKQESQKSRVMIHEQ